MFATAILLSVMTAIMLAVGFLLLGTLGMAFALLFSLMIIIISYWFSDKIVLWVNGAKESDDPELLRMVGDMAREAGIPKPKLYMVASEVPNAFATGRNPAHASVAVTQGLSVLTKDEMEAVIAHEIFLIRKKDTLILTTAAAIAGAISFLATLGYWNLYKGRTRELKSVFGMLLIAIFAPVAILIVRLSISRRRDYMADHGSVLISKHPVALASALRKMSKIREEKQMHASPATTHMWIVNPLTKDWYTGLFSSHPPVRKRITKLERIIVDKGEKHDG